MNFRHAMRMSANGVIRYTLDRGRPSPHVRCPPKATELLRRREMQRSAKADSRAAANDSVCRYSGNPAFFNSRTQSSGVMSA